MKHTLIALAVAGTLWLPRCAAGATSEKVLCLTLEGDLLDKAEVLLARTGFRIRNRLGTIYWFSEKGSVVYLANPENKTYFAQPAEEYLKELREDLHPMKYTRLDRKPKTFPDGTKAEIVTAFLKSPGGNEMIVAEITCLKNSGLSPAVNRMWCALMGLPEKDFSLPIGTFQNRSNDRRQREPFAGGKKRWKIVAWPRKVERKNVDEKLLKLPLNYKVAKDKASLYLSSDGNLSEKDLEDFFISPKK